MSGNFGNGSGGAERDIRYLKPHDRFGVQLSAELDLEKTIAIPCDYAKENKSGERVEWNGEVLTIDNNGNLVDDSYSTYWPDRYKGKEYWFKWDTIIYKLDDPEYDFVLDLLGMR